MTFKSALKSLPLIGPLASGFAKRLARAKFENSGAYWERRYQTGGNSGAGSYNRLALFKAEFLNEFVSQNEIRSVIEFGSGDGAQLELAQYPSYVGIDVARTAVEWARKRFGRDPTMTFYHSSEVPPGLTADLALSLDVIYHLVEDAAFDSYMRQLFNAASQFVIIYASNHDETLDVAHVRHRRFTDWIDEMRPDFTMVRQVPNRYPFDAEDPDNTSFADFFIYQRT